MNLQSDKPLNIDLQPIERQRIYESIVDQMRQLIISGRWKPGQRIPPERELTTMLSVGRTSVREALRILEALGFIEIHAGNGSYVKQDIEIPSALHNLIQVVQGDEYFAEIMETRELFDAQIAYLAAQNATSDDIQALAEIVDRQSESVNKGLDGVEENIEFHLRLTEISGNRVMVEFQRLLFKLSRQSINQLFQIHGFPEESVRQHREIIRSIQESNPLETHRLMLKHLRSRYAVLKSITSQQD